MCQSSQNWVSEAMGKAEYLMEKMNDGKESLQREKSLTIEELKIKNYQ